MTASSHPNKARRFVLSLVGVLGGVALAIAAFAPYLYPEYVVRVYGADAPVLPPPKVPVAGRWFDDYFLIEDIDSTTFAIGEPRYYQGNYSYLLLGERRAILFDAGTGTRDIVPVVRSLTSLPVTVIPSHLHFDHVGALGRFERTALLDDPTLRQRTINGSLTLKRYEFLGLMDDLPVPPAFHVDEWWAPGSFIDLGARRVQVLSTPGHTPTSVALHDAGSHQLFIGDFIYPGELYAFLPGASRSAYLRTTRRLLAQLDPITRIFPAHMANPPAPVRAPVMAISDLNALERALTGMLAGTVGAQATGELPRILGYPRVYPVSDNMTFVTGYPWNNR